MNKKGLLQPLLIISIILIILILFTKLSRAETFTNEINMTLKVNLSEINLNISNVIYTFNNSNLTFDFKYYSNFSIEINQTNLTIQTNFTCTNTSVFVSCSCPSNVAPVYVNYSIPNEFNLSESTKQDLYQTYLAQLTSKIEESSNKVAQDVIFKLEPTQAKIDDCERQSFNASLREQEAYKMRDKIASDNIAITSVLENTRDELRTLQIVALSFLALIVLSVASYFGLWERKGRLF